MASPVTTDDAPRPLPLQEAVAPLPGGLGPAAPLPGDRSSRDRNVIFFKIFYR